MESHTCKELKFKISTMLHNAMEDKGTFKKHFFVTMIQNFHDLIELYDDEIEKLERRNLELDKELLFRDV